MKKYRIKGYRSLKDFGIYEFETDVQLEHLIALKGEEVYSVKEISHLMEGHKEISTTLYVLEVKPY